ncbi:P-loop containing nucleoside triphosphate hydrolases superfamily protein [Arabidopsis thaliana]|uniref:Kinesin-like protein KIN-7K, chloroplastic n=2 Tax=Arabidopsis thaliana TaxID=3702 RepID=KN7K_ARATH|nr:P-loop containing nucleoside triphosphate hydrolases superfamily protein [Arabidopsis thaliana]NP_187809.3 P-loop containing nucleoside triphosphate hydrolases superfamily protein [Arabidopsis thaliana]F4J8L3.1 RecName: Full=Kinesin-like protein KIN-7K, chloroplastic; Flags: Precursor [Arabidopsis thaliana]AEE75137.1 P-loop containing nucleoside triphosphate hydrolases superfamily protein [Arabidopsis thaliana]ANM63541.1 P-loop containing nucleoside triphosphate hydrolases superfamily protei|eukprot:NP_001325623.1 P-loop containing nucleoside triphosphate hydrolases superfamily protein [Arabidopsis thaliana]
MASRQGSKSRKAGLKGADSTASSTTSSSKLYQETSIDGHSSPASSSAQSKQQFFSPDPLPQTAQRSKENVTVTVRFRPLSPREIRQGEEVAWYADGETIVRNEHNPTIAYAYDRVFGPTTTTRNVYDIAAHHVVNGAMEGINGTIFAYGVTSSGKTHTMHGDQRSPGIIPLAVKDAFSIIQETPNREFLLRISYMEIYNEVVNDLLNPAGHNLRIREDKQGTFVEGIKEEVVLSPAHALSLIAAGEEQRHVGSTNFNLLSSRSHTIFTLTIESSPLGDKSKGEAVHLSQLNLVDLAGSESSKVETSGVRRKEGSYINKSLLTLGTVISKLTDVRASHVPYRDSKLTRILQSSLSGHDRVSLICTVTPASSSSEETHNTLKFAHRAKHIEIQAEQNKIIDEKSLIKKYQREIRQLKEELEQLKQEIVPVPQLKDIGADDIVLLKQKLEDGQVKLQSRLEEEEEAKAALLSRIQRLTKLILVSTKNPQASRLPHRFNPRRRHSFGEEELAYLPYKRRDMMDDEQLDLYVSVEGNHEIRDNAYREEKKTRKHGLLNWLKPKKRDHSSSASDQSSVVKSNSTPSTPQGGGSHLHTESRLSEGSPLMEQLSEPREDREALEDSSHEMEIPETSNKMSDELDLLREQKKILSEEAALQLSSLKRMSDEAAKSPQNEEINEEIKVLNDDIKAKNDQIATLERQIMDFVMTSHEALDKSDIMQAVAELRDQLNEKSFELEVKAADNRIIQQTLNEKTCECEVLQEEVANLKQQLSEALELAQGTKIKELKQDAKELSESKEQLELRNRKLAEESSYAKGLASAAAVELKALSEEVAKLMNQNERLAAELATQKSPIAQRNKTGTTTNVRNNGRRESLAKRQEHDSPSMELKRELRMSKERELSYEAALGEKEQREAELERILEETKQREAYLENELANMWVLVSKLRRSQGADSEISDSISETRQTEQTEGSF